MEHLVNHQEINNLVKDFSCEFNNQNKSTAVILAAGHGKRIKSQTSKMLHKIWEIPTVNRVCSAWKSAITDSNTIVVVGIKADDVIKSVGKSKDVSFAYQQEQHGTGHALQVGLVNVPRDYDGVVYVFPGDMGLIDSATIQFFKSEFEKSNSDMMVLTGLYEGAVEENYYGRIVRVKDKDAKGEKSKFKGKVIEIIEYKDILNLDKKKPYTAKYKKKNFNFTQKELIENCEFNSGVYAFKSKPLFELIDKIGNNNVQNEVYLTDLIGMFNENGYSVEAVSPKEQYVLMGFNNKSVLKEMDSIAQKLVYERLKDIVLIEDSNDFFIHESVVEELLSQDKSGVILDIEIGKGVYIGSGVKLNLNIKLEKNVRVNGNVSFGKNVTVESNSLVTSEPGKSTYIGNNVLLKGECIVDSTFVGEGSMVERSVLINKRIESGSTIKFYKPEVEIKGSVSNL